MFILPLITFNGKKIKSKIGLICLLFSLMGHAAAVDGKSVYPTNHTTTEILTLAPNQSDNCERALAMYHEHVLYSYHMAQGQGLGTASVENPNPTYPAINANLLPDGDSDRLGFTQYYNPTVPFYFHHQLLGLKGIILNVCPVDQMQGGLLLIIPSGDVCLMTSRIWNYCR